MQIDLVVKIGGSSITVKEKYETLRPEALRSASSLIKACVEKRLSIVVVHGAGSFGHHQAKEFGVNHGWVNLDGDKDTTAVNKVKRGVCLTRQSVTKLHHLVLSALVDEQIPAISLPCIGGWESDNRVLVKHDIDSITKFLQHGFVPVLHGDAILDQRLGCVILSGDTIIQTICQECKVDRVVFLTSVDGIYDKPPLQYTDAQLLREILINKDGKISTDNPLSASSEKIISGSSVHDVTGGMTLKLQTAINIVRNSIGRTTVYVCKLGSQSGLDACCTGLFKSQTDSGTVIRYLDTCT